MSRRIQRVEKELQQVIANFLLSGLKDPLQSMVTVSHVQASPDLRHAKVFVSFFGPDADPSEDLEILNDHAHLIQKEINKKVPMKFCPKVKFYLNTGLEHANKVESIIKTLHSNDGNDE